MFISIIIPVYKVEKYLHQCINSILKQKFKEYEIILIDDGSPDSCPSICDEYAKKNERIKVVHQENSGVSNARNTGLKIAKGDFIMFLDGDDIMTEESLIKVYELIKEKNSDLFIFAYNELYSENELKHISIIDTKEETITINNKKDYYKILDLTKTVIFQVWGKVFNRSIIINNEIFFDESLISAEDCDFFFRYYLKTNNVFLSNIAVTNYRRDNEGAVTRNLSYKVIYSNLIAFKKCFDTFYNIDSKVAKYFANKYANIISTIYIVKDREQISNIVKLIEESNILSYTQGKKYTVAKLFWKLFGYYNGSKILAQLRGMV